MKMLLTVPLRTPLELPVPYSAKRPTEFIDALKGLSTALQEKLGKNYAVKPLEISDDSSIELYKRLDEDAIPVTLLPLLSVNFLKEIDLTVFALPGCSEVRLSDAVIHLYDRTLAILELLLDFDDLINMIDFESNVDSWSDLFVKSVIEKLQIFSVAAFDQLTLIQPNQEHGIMFPVGRKSSFFDAEPPMNQSLNLKKLWVSRVVFTDTEDLNKAVWDTWTQGQASERPAVKLGKQAGVLCVGNSVVFGKVDLAIIDTLQRGLRLSNLIYATVHVLSKNLRAVHGDFIGGKLHPVLASDVTSSIRNTLDVAERDYEDSLQGIQGGRSAVVTNYLKAWSFEALLNTAHKRIGSISAMIQELIVRRNIRYSRLVESALSIIGGITLLDFSLNLMTFSRSDASIDDGVYGLIDLVRSASEDKLLYGLLLMIGLVGVSKFLKK